MPVLSQSSSSSSSPTLREWFNQVLIEKIVDTSALNDEMFGNYTQADVEILKNHWFPEPGHILLRGKLQNVWAELQNNKGNKKKKILI
jgi:hypothetical protein